MLTELEEEIKFLGIRGFFHFSVTEFFFLCVGGVSCGLQLVYYLWGLNILNNNVFGILMFSGLYED